MPISDGDEEHYVQGDDPLELHLRSKHANPEKQKHSILIPVTAQTAKNVGFTLRNAANAARPG